MQDSTGLIGFKVHIHQDGIGDGTIMGSYVDFGGWESPDTEKPFGEMRIFPTLRTWFVIQGKDGQIWQFTSNCFYFVAPPTKRRTKEPPSAEQIMLRRMFERITEISKLTHSPSGVTECATAILDQFSGQWEAIR